jgi:ribosomal protein L44E
MEQRFRRSVLSAPKRLLSAFVSMTMQFVNQAQCRQCGQGMERVAVNAPFGSEPGLVAFLCPECGSTASMLVHPVNTTREVDHGHRERRERRKQSKQRA